MEFPVVPAEYLWYVVAAFIVAFILAFGIGANDVANSFGTSVGAKVLSLRTACILASIFETLGAVLLGAKVSDTIRKGIIDIEPYTNETTLLVIGNVAALSGSCVWMIIATVLRLPVSATHSIVGATVGFALVAHGVKGVVWRKLAMIIASWFISPIMAGLVAVGIFYFSKFFILQRDDPLEPGLRFLPIFYGITLLVNFLSVFYDGPRMLRFHLIPLWGTFVLSFGLAILCAIFVRFFVVPWQRKRIEKDVARLKGLPEKSKEEPDTKSAGKVSVCCIPCPCIEAPSMDSTISSNNSENDNLNMEEEERMESFHHNATARKRTMSGCSNISVTLVPLVPPSVHAITDITHPNVKLLEKHASKINKAEDAPLMNHEYKLQNGTCAKISESEKEKSATGFGEGNHAPTKSSKDSEGAGGVEKQDKKEALLNSATVLMPKSEGLQGGRNSIQDRPETARLFSFLQVLTATFGAFAHGGNDVSNAIAPLVTIWIVTVHDQVLKQTSTPVLLLAYGGVGISLGLWVWGRRVIKTIGEDLTKITPSSGFAIELGSATTVLIASNIGVPISTTHCKVGSVVFVGRFRARENVDWSIFRNIVLAWVITLPVTGAISAAIMAGLMALTGQGP